ncbi:MAG: molybdopterin molybdotransferase MoeA, partial [Puniceicoccales bacterium]
DYIHATGSDFAAQSILVKAGARMGPAAMGVAASCGYATVAVSPRPRIAIATTGDELVPVQATPEPHQIRMSNAATLESALALAGFHVGEIAHWRDEPEVGARMLAEVLERIDVLVVVGAVSKGARDWLPTALDAVADKVFHGVRQRPGKPMGFWKTKDDRAIFALPGNPVSAMTGLHRYVLPFIRQRDGQMLPPLAEIELAADISFEPPLTWFLPVKLNSNGRAEPCPVNNSGDYARLVETDGFIELAAEQTSWIAGFRAPFYPWSS